MNGCDLLVHAGNTVGRYGRHRVPRWKIRGISFYNSAAHTTATCTVTFGSVTGLSGITATNETTSPSTVSVEGTVENIPAQLHGSCSFGLTINTQGSLHAAGTITGTGGVGIRIS
jgi:hypothetical protein